MRTNLSVGICTVALFLSFWHSTVTHGQEITNKGVARSASLFSALISQCQEYYYINVPEARKYQAAFAKLGVQTIGIEEFKKLLAIELDRRLAEVRVTGVKQWCEYQKSHSIRIGEAELFESTKKVALDEPTKKVTADEMAMLLASLVISQKRCGLLTNDVPLNVVVARRGFDLVSFLPDGLYGPVVEVKMKKANEFLAAKGSKKGCEGIVGAVRKFLPDIVK